MEEQLQNAEEPVKKKRGRKPGSKNKKKKEKPKSPNLSFTNLSAKHQEFFINYLKLRNAVQAYMLAYPNSQYSTACVNSHRLLRNTKIQKALREHYNNLWNKKEDEVGKTFENLLKIANADIKDIVKVNEHGNVSLKNLDEIDTMGVKGISFSRSDNKYGETTHTSIQMLDKQKAISDLLRVLSMIQEKMKVKITYDKESAKAIKEIFNESVVGEEDNE